MLPDRPKFHEKIINFTANNMLFCKSNYDNNLHMDAIQSLNFYISSYRDFFLFLGGGWCVFVSGCVCVCV